MLPVRERRTGTGMRYGAHFPGTTMILNASRARIHGFSYPRARVSPLLRMTSSFASLLRAGIS